mmetsp:Transcript_21990/g.70833  ORF Transcript_21990/g.70833 Transcript_21990/m.70833 type:complete len:339 (-) Transcript_21990:97-1113(-)
MPNATSSLLRAKDPPHQCGSLVSVRKGRRERGRGRPRGGRPPASLRRSGFPLPSRGASFAMRSFAPKEKENEGGDGAAEDTSKQQRMLSRTATVSLTRRTRRRRWRRRSRRSTAASWRRRTVPGRRCAFRSMPFATPSATRPHARRLPSSTAPSKSVVDVTGDSVDVPARVKTLAATSSRARAASSLCARSLTRELEARRSRLSSLASRAAVRTVKQSSGGGHNKKTSTAASSRRASRGRNSALRRGRRLRADRLRSLRRHAHDRPRRPRQPWPSPPPPPSSAPSASTSPPTSSPGQRPSAAPPSPAAFSRRSSSSHRWRRRLLGSPLRRRLAPPWLA